MNRIYDAFTAGLIAGTLGDLESAAWKVSLHDSTAAFVASAASTSGLGGMVGDRVDLTVSLAGDALWFGTVGVTSVPSGRTVVASVVSIGTKPVAWFDHVADGTVMGLVTTGDDVTVMGLVIRLSRPGG